MEGGDEWLAADKLEHLLACFVITLLVANLSGRSRHAFVRRRSAALGSLVALAAGTAKEVADEIGIWRSAGASAKDAAADVLGVLLAAMLLAVFGRLRSSSRREVEMIGDDSLV
ncbi:uncharacterized protein LOC122034100 [Zingiber officinale]|uniref:uncharacterized protein LOC122032238 n=1 Tax=Zingiber officinale TaxID=94328 RepID=UPI001C4D99EC|nr:uncharacterized protein LOC122032238 [Zingiber officinale]XP_042449162.1 uncharacterized protein LOC122034100 [Zingiber officinale]